MKKIKNQNGSITLYVLLSMMFFLIVLIGIYVKTSNNIQAQEKQYQKIQQQYVKQNIDDLYEKAK